MWCSWDLTWKRASLPDVSMTTVLHGKHRSRMESSTRATDYVPTMETGTHCHQESDQRLGCCCCRRAYLKRPWEVLHYDPTDLQFAWCRESSLGACNLALTEDIGNRACLVDICCRWAIWRHTSGVCIDNRCKPVETQAYVVGSPERLRLPRYLQTCSHEASTLQ